MFRNPFKMTLPIKKQIDEFPARGSDLSGPMTFVLYGKDSVDLNSAPVKNTFTRHYEVAIRFKSAKDGYDFLEKTGGNIATLQSNNEINLTNFISDPRLAEQTLRDLDLTLETAELHVVPKRPIFEAFVHDSHQYKDKIGKPAPAALVNQAKRGR